MANGQITSFEEKPIIENLVNAGMYVFEPEIFNYIKEGKCDFALNVFPALLKQKKKISTFTFEDYWVDIGRLIDYEDINRIMGIIEMTKF